MKIVFNKTLLFLCLFSHAAVISAQNKETLVIAHRAGAAFAPENSISAVLIALNSDAQCIEVDVRMTSDSVLVLMHDKKINRTTYGKGHLKNMTYDELCNFKLKGIHDSLPDKVPTLEDIFNTVNKKKTLVLEIKKHRTNPQGIEQQLVSLIQEHNAHDWCVVHSFSDKVLGNIYRLDSNVRLNKLLFAGSSCLPLVIDHTLRFKSLKKYKYIEDFSIHHLFASRRIIRKLHALNKKVNVWTVNKERRAQKLFRRGADGIITDNLILKK